MAHAKRETLTVARTPEISDQTKQDQEEIRERFWQAVERIGERNADEDPDETLRFVTEVVEEVRQEQHERTVRAKGRAC